MHIRETSHIPAFGHRSRRIAAGFAAVALVATALGAFVNPAGAAKSGPHAISTNVYFASGDATLTKRSKAALRKLVLRVPADAVRVHANITGWVQATPSKANDLTLSTARAKRAASFMRTVGFTGAMHVKGLGIKNKTAAARRVTAVIHYTLPYNLTTSAGANGAISPSSIVQPGASATVTITPNACYRVADVQVDGASVGAVTTYTLSGVKADHTVNATFTPADFTVTATAGANGTITPSGAVIVKGTSDQTFAIAANAGYHVADVLVDGKSVGALTSVKLVNVCGTHTVAASFAADPVVVYPTPTATPTPTPTVTPTPTPSPCIDGNGGDKCRGKGSDGHSKDGVNNGKGPKQKSAATPQ